MTKKYAAELAEARMYRFTLFTVDDNALAEITVTKPAFLMILRRYNDGHPHAFTEYTLRELRMRAEPPDRYYVEIQAETEAWIPFRGTDHGLSPGGYQANA